MAKLKIGNAVVSLCSSENGKCLHFGSKRCTVKKKNIREQQKKLLAAKSKKLCIGKDTNCPQFVGKNLFVPQYDEKYLLPIKESELIAHVLANSHNVLCAGPPGSGKSSLILQIASILNWGVERYSCSEETTSSKIIGQWVVIGDTMQWVDGYVTNAVRNGLILLEDEVDFMRPELRGEIHSLMEQSGTITLTSVHPETQKPFKELIRKHKNFRWISTANTIGHGDDLFAFHGTQYMNAASRDRYEIIIKFKYREPEEEITILCEKTEVDTEMARSMVSVANKCRDQLAQGMVFQFSLRRLLAWAQWSILLNIEESSKLSILNFCNEVDYHTIKALLKTDMNIDA